MTVFRFAFDAYGTDKQVRQEVSVQLSGVAAQAAAGTLQAATPPMSAPPAGLAAVAARDATDHAGMPDASTPDAGIWQRSREVAEYARALLEGAQRHDLTVDQLAGYGLLPPLFSDAALEAATLRLMNAARKISPYIEMSNDLPYVEGFRNAVAAGGIRLARVLALAAAASGNSGASIASALDAVVRYEHPKDVETALFTTMLRVEHSRFGAIESIIPGSHVESVRLWWIEVTSIPPLVDRVLDLEMATASRKAWHEWALDVAHHWSTKRPRDHAFTEYMDIVLAASGQAPSSLLREDLSSVTVAEWSDLAILGLTPPGNASRPSPPAWSVLMGLRALGFGSEALRQLRSEFVPPSLPADEEAIVFDLLRNVPAQAKKGFIVARLAIGSSTELPRTGDHPPMLALSPMALRANEKLIKILYEAEAIAGVMFERANSTENPGS